MIAVGVGSVWVGYYVGMYGYCLVRGYNVSFRDLFGQVWPDAKAAGGGKGKKGKTPHPQPHPQPGPSPTPPPGG